MKQAVCVQVFHPSKCSVHPSLSVWWTPGWNFYRFGKNIHLDSRMYRLDFGGHRSRSFWTDWRSKTDAQILQNFRSTVRSRYPAVRMYTSIFEAWFCFIKAALHGSSSRVPTTKLAMLIPFKSCLNSSKSKVLIFFYRLGSIKCSITVKLRQLSQQNLFNFTTSNIYNPSIL